MLLAAAYERLGVVRVLCVAVRMRSIEAAGEGTFTEGAFILARCGIDDDELGDDR